MKLIIFLGCLLSCLVWGLTSCEEEEELPEPTVSLWAEVGDHNFAYFVVNGDADYFVLFTGNRDITITDFEPGDTIRYRYAKLDVYEAYAVASNVSEYGKEIKRTVSNIVELNIE